MTAHYQWALRFAKKVKDQVGCKIIFGGVHATSVPDVVRENSFVDEVVEGCGVKYFGGAFIPDVIFPSWKDFFAELPRCHRIHPFIMTDFGCPFSCSYCLPRELKIKAPRRPVDGCIRELKELKRMGAKRFSIWDDTFTRDKDWLTNFLIRYIDEVNLPFRCLTHPTCVDPEIVGMLKEAGCYTIDMGIQSGDQILRAKILNRWETNDQFLRACSLIKRAGIRLVIDHIFEIPGETDVSQQMSFDLYRKAKPDLIHCFKLLYFPKAPIIQKALEYGKLNIEDVAKIERGEFVLYASGENQRVAKINPWVKKFLAIPLGGGAWEKMPDWLIKLACYIRIGEDFLPQTIMQNQVYFTWKRILKLR
jgi:tRNA A37 methylthiotransferase MiaB